MSNRAAEYRQMIEDILPHWHLLGEDERAELRDMIARAERRALAHLPADTATEAAE